MLFRAAVSNFGGIKTMMKLLPAIIFMMCFGCKEITFENPQPEGRRSLNTMPKPLRGKYLATGDGGEVSKDTIIVNARGYRFGYYSPADRVHLNDSYDAGVISDTLVIRSYKDYYFVNVREGPEWLLRVIKRETNGDLTYMSMERSETDFKDYVDKLAAEIRIDSFLVEGVMVYRIDPTPHQLVGLIEKGFFSESRLVRIK